MTEQLTLFSESVLCSGKPTWDDVQKKRARTVTHSPYSHACHSDCFWFPDISNGRCYLFAKPVIGGQCPATTRLEWT